jgi:hypothetical protein
LASLSNTEAEIESKLELVPLSNLKIVIEPMAGGSPGGEIYAKVIGHAPGIAGQTRVRFTSVSPALKVWVRGMAAGEQPVAAGTG